MPFEEVREWQNRPLDPVYPVVFFDALRVKIRDDGLVRNKAVYVALALDVDGEKHVLGLWIEQSEGAKFWLKVMNELKTRGVGDILIAVIDGLKGFPEAIAGVFPETTVQTCIVLLAFTFHQLEAPQDDHVMDSRRDDHPVVPESGFCGWARARKLFVMALAVACSHVSGL